MANLTYRQSSTPTLPGSTTTKGTPLTNLEIDANMKALNDEIQTKANIASPTFTGTPAAPTATAGTNTTQLATTAFVTAALTAADAPTKAGVGATGTWGISITGSAASATTSTSSTTSTNLAGGAVGSIPYQSGAGTTAFLAAGTSGWLFSSGGAGAPQYVNPATISVSYAATSGTANATNTANNFQMNSLGVGTAGSGTAGEIRATANVTAYYSSDRILKENIKPIENALAKVQAIGGKTYDWTDSYLKARGGADGYFVQKNDFGVIAQDVQKVFPVAVRTREDGTLAVDYEKLASLAFQAIIELTARVAELERKVE